ncbi:MAG: trypsin-like peptidase domain-containing protein [Clostridia bacterium]|nr:trypsin-like peptidase domain-containing protein [Clostridia bacterium]
MLDDQNSQYEHDPGKGQENIDGNTENKTYSYVFSDGFYNNENENRLSPKQKKSRTGFPFAVMITLCVCIAFVGAFGGSVFVNYLFKINDKDLQDTEETQLQNVLSDNPEEILSRVDSEESVYGSAGEDVFAVSGVVRKVQNAVVVIDVVSSGSAYGNASTGAGSGVIISKDGYLLTCNHVVEGASSVKVTLNSGEVYQATLVGSDESSDLAVLKIDPGEKELTYVQHGRSEHLVVGEEVVAIGNPLGTLGGTVTTGIISATERNIQMSDGSVMTLIQTDAAINSGNSGGGLFNLDGDLVGIVNAKYSASGVEGLAFAIPIDSAYVVELDLIQYGYVRGVVDHGLSITEISQNDWSYYKNYYYYNYGISEPGLYINSSEYTGELQYLDRIVSVNGVEISTKQEFESEIDRCAVGDKVTVVVLRNGVRVTVSLTLQEYVPERLKDLNR